MAHASQPGLTGTTLQQRRSQQLTTAGTPAGSQPAAPPQSAPPQTQPTGQPAATNGLNPSANTLAGSTGIGSSAVPAGAPTSHPTMPTSLPPAQHPLLTMMGGTPPPTPSPTPPPGTTPPGGQSSTAPLQATPQAQTSGGSYATNNWHPVTMPNAGSLGGPLGIGAMSNWMTSTDENNLRNNVGSFNDLNNPALQAQQDQINDLSQANSLGSYSLQGARDMQQNAIDRQTKLAQMQLDAQQARGGQMGTGAETGLYGGAQRASLASEQGLQSQMYNQEAQRLGMLGNARNAYANTNTQGSQVDMQNIMDQFTSNKELFGALMQALPQVLQGLNPMG